ncbi:very-long-chain 3-oxoacyl-CoA reductase [Lepeophtheirus salmonis]|nr:very-long-chain 3-oxoacyl-CoA reductase-like [Lepeophtheirus salmonis]
MLSLIYYSVVIYSFTKLLLSIFELIYTNFVLEPLDVRKCGGDWALVTGSTDGIGKAYARALASKGLNIILISRTLSKLEGVSQEIKEEFGVKVKIIDVDFSKDPNDYASRIEQEISKLKIGVLVNNVGMSYEHPEEYLDIENGDEVVSKIVSCNITSLNTMVRLVLPQMKNRGRGAVINISSFTALFPFPLLSAYAASKSYVASLTKGLKYEYESMGITVQCILPAYVCSNMSKIRKASLLIPTADDFVKSALKRLGRQSFTSGYWVHEAQSIILGCLPEVLNVKLTYDQLHGIKIKALKKKSKS